MRARRAGGIRGLRAASERNVTSTSEADTGPARALSWTRRIVAGLAAAWVLYLLAANLLLNSSPGRDLANRQPEKFRASWDSAWTLYPGHLRATDLRIAGHVRRTVWSLQADSIRGRVALLPLLAKELRMPAVVAEGVAGGASLVDVERPPVPRRPGGWTLRFDRVVADRVRHAYLGDLVLAGSGRAETGFAKVLRGGPMEVLPSQASFEQGVVWRDGVRLAWNSNVTASFAVARHLREEAPGLRKLDKTDFTVGIDATTAGLRLVLRPGTKAALQATDGPGSLHAKLGWQRGSLQPGGRLELLLPVEDDLDGKVESTQAKVSLEVRDEDIRLAGGLNAPRENSIHLDADVTLRGTAIPLMDPASMAARTSGHIRSRWHFDSLAWLARFIPGSNLVSFDGAGTVLADLRLSAGKLDPGSYLDVPQVAATANALGNRFQGDARARITFEDATDGELQPRLEAVMQHFSVAPAEAPDQPYVHGRDLRIEAFARGRRDDLRENVHARLWFADAQLPDIRMYNRYLPKTSLRFTGGSGRVSGHLRFDREGAVGSGDFRVTGNRVQLGLAGLSLEGDVDIVTKLRRADLERHRFDADGSRVSLRRVRVTDGDELLGSDWWSEISLDQARLDWDQPISLDGRLRARMRDISVLLGVYSQRKHLPDWVARMLDDGEARAEGRVQWRNDALLLEPFAAGNDRFDVRARLRLQDKHPTGDLFAQWGALSVGVELADGRKDYHVVGARKWFDGQPDLAAR
jgi:hypothetical protein